MTELLSAHSTYGIITLDGNACNIGVICGPETKVLATFSDDLPNRHRKGGQSSQRFQRLRLERRGAYVTKAADKAISVFVKDGLPTVVGLFLGGCAEFKDQLLESLPRSLRDKHIASVTCAETGRAAFAEACAKCMPMITVADLAEGEKALNDFFDSMEKDDGKAVIGLQEVVTCLEEGLVETLLVSTESERMFEEMLLAEWADARYQELVEKVTCRTALGSRFLDMGGIGAILRFPVDPVIYTVPEEIEVGMDDA